VIRDFVTQEDKVTGERMDAGDAVDILRPPELSKFISKMKDKEVRLVDEGVHGWRGRTGTGYFLLPRDCEGL